MKIIHRDIRNGEVKVKVDTQEDLWYLSHIVDAGDLISGKTERKMKFGSGDNITVERKLVTLELRATKIELTEHALRITGTITQGPEDTPRGSHHTFAVSPETTEHTIKITKQRWLSFQLGKLNEAVQDKKTKILICVLDREQASFALLKRYGFEMLSEIEGKVQKKAVDEKVKSTYYAEIVKMLSDYDERFHLHKIVVASPSFWKEYLMEELKKTPLKSKIILATCYGSGKQGIHEVLKRPEVATALKEDKIVEELQLVDSLLREIHTNNLGAYGFKEVKSAAEMGAVKVLLITDNLIRKRREAETYAALDHLMRQADEAKGDIHIISSEHDGGKQLDGLGGIAALLRYKIA